MIFKIFRTFHVITIIVISSLSTYFVYCDYKELPKDNVIAKNISEGLAKFKGFRYYTRWTGTETGYGFFSPSVRSRGYIEVMTCGEKFYPKFKSLEANNRYMSMSTSISEHFFSNSQENNSLQEHNTNKDDYFNLIYKNIATKLINEVKCFSGEATINYTLIDYPTLERLKYNKQVALIKIQEITYENKK
jgi:hypothetical protein